MDLSVCIVNYNTGDYLLDCLRSIKQYSPALAYEIIIIDNGSTDGVLDQVGELFPEVILIRNEFNRGFSAPLNQGLRVATGDYLAALNPDTKLTEDCFTAMVSYLKNHPEVGVIGPKVLNRDGSLQLQCRRGEARPVEVFSYFLGLDKVFPKHKKMSGYLLRYLAEDEVTEVKALSCSCMVIRRDTLEQAGFFDERFFAYQEDSDFCFQARKLGWKVVYFPETQLIHYGGRGGSAVKPFKGIYHWHKSYYLYYKKNLAKDYSFIANGIFYVFMFLKYLFAITKFIFTKKPIVGTPKP